MKTTCRVLSICLSFFLASNAAYGACRQALAIGLDVSGSVDSAEYALQMQGLANALMHPEVQGALLAIPSSPVSLAVFEWSGPASQRVTLPWTVIDSPDAIADAASTLSSAARPASEPSTAIGAAMLGGVSLLRKQSTCTKQTLDLSGDGISNTGSHPRDIIGTALNGITINGLVILPTREEATKGTSQLSDYYQAFVLRGPDAFVETANGFADFEAAMVRKLKRELEGLTLSANAP
jgi:hypothetical protein